VWVDSDKIAIKQGRNNAACRLISLANAIYGPEAARHLWSIERAEADPQAALNLQRRGIRVTVRGRSVMMVIAARHPALDKVFEATRWSGL
jgi:hypothetical protein